jgi:hypothetical protein
VSHLSSNSERDAYIRDKYQFGKFKSIKEQQQVDLFAGLDISPPSSTPSSSTSSRRRAAGTSPWVPRD